MTKKEQKMLLCLQQGAEPQEAAKAAGYRVDSPKDLKRLLKKESIAAELERQKQGSVRQRIRRVLEHIAFGPVEDAAHFMKKMSEEDANWEESKGALLSVAELKQRQGGYEVKFYDRLRAMEMLERLEESSQEATGKDLAQVLEESVRSMGIDGED